MWSVCHRSWVKICKFYLGPIQYKIPNSNFSNTLKFIINKSKNTKYSVKVWEVQIQISPNSSYSIQILKFSDFYGIWPYQISRLACDLPKLFCGFKGSSGQQTIDQPSEEVKTLISVQNHPTNLLSRNNLLWVWMPSQMCVRLLIIHQLV